MSIKDNLYRVQQRIPAHVGLVAISKTRTASEILEVYENGVRDFGENKVQELLLKYEELPKDIRWHLIGHLQTNKVKYVASFIHCIQSVDSLKLLKEINKEALKHNRVISCLLQIYIAKEESKFGLSWPELVEILENEEFRNLKNISIDGVMGMATYTSDENIIEKEFTELVATFNKLQQEYFKEHASFKEISMGMSSDYEIAIRCGSTVVRVGSLIFGERQYNRN